jgi:hypothetical protein
MGKISADQLRELIIAIIIENAEVRASVGPVWHPPFIDLEDLPAEFDTALDEINEVRTGQKLARVEVLQDFKTAVIDTLVRRMESAGRVLVRG